MKSSLFYLIFMMLVTSGLGQSVASFDGVKLKLMDENRSEYYYGEPFRVFFRIMNTKSTPSLCHKYYHGFNLKLELKDLNSGQTIRHNNDPWNAPMASGMRNNKSQTPTVGQVYSGGEVSYFYPHMEKSFGSVPLTNKAISGISLLKHNMFAIPVGDYELTVTYYLYPSKRVLKVKHEFSIVEIPKALLPDFKDYISATYYCNETRSGSRKPYSVKNPNSYESYFAKANSSIFKDYAMIDRAVEPYYRGITDSEQRRQRIEYLRYFPSTNNKDIGLAHVRLLPKVIRNEAKVSSKSSLQLSNDALKGSLNKSYGASKMFITLSSMKGVIGLVNHASQK